MTDTLLRSLRDHLLDESEPVAGLLRKCLLLGAETGSQALREWARQELRGYDDHDDVPEYRKARDISMLMNSISGNTTVSNQPVDRLQVPPDARKYISEETEFRQPVEELEKLASQESVAFTSPGLTAAIAVWNQKLGAFQRVIDLHYTLSGSAFAGMVGQIRTQLVDVIADLTSDTPLAELPKKEQVDAAVVHHIGQIYSTTITGSSAPVAVGAGASASGSALTVDEALTLLEAVRQASDAAHGVDTGELVQAVNELRDLVQQDAPDTGAVVKKAGRLRVLAEKVGVGAISAATSSAVSAVTELAMGGAFG